MRSSSLQVFLWMFLAGSAIVCPSNLYGSDLPAGKLDELLQNLNRHFEPLGRGEYVTRGAGYTLQLTPNGVDMVPDAAKTGTIRRIRMEFLGASPRAGARQEEPLESRSNYLTGNDAAAWRTGVEHYGRIRYSDIYPGIDVVYYADRANLEYDLVVTGGADPDQIRLRFSGMQKLEANAQGDLVIKMADGHLLHRRPVIYQMISGVKAEIAGRYVLLSRNVVGFELASYDRSQPVVIDPVMRFATYYGGTGSEISFSSARDADGNLYIGGTTNSPVLPSSGGIQPALSGNFDAFVARFSAAGTLVYSTFIGGSAAENAPSLTVDAAGQVYMTGRTVSTNFPRVNAFQNARSGTNDAFVLKLNSAGTALIYSTYLGAPGVTSDSAKQWMRTET